MAGETTDIVTSTGTTGNTGKTSTTGGDIVGKPSGVESSLSNWVGPYVTDMLAKGQALSNQPYQAYTGPLTAGQSALQKQAYQGIANLQVPASIGQAATTSGQIAQQAQNLKYSPTAFTNQYTAPTDYKPTDITTGQFTDQGIAQQYMNPYLQQALEPQIFEARRQAEIENLKNKAAATKAGAYGGTRGALMESENQRNLLQDLGLITGKGYETAYQKAQEAYMADQARALQAQQAAEQSRQFGYGQKMTASQLAAQYALEAQKAAEQSKQFGANYGLQGLQTAAQAAAAQGQLGTAQSQAQLSNLAKQMEAGAQQRAIEQEGITADYGQFQEARDYPYKQVQYQQSLLQNLPLQAQSYTYNEPSALSNILTSSKGILGLYDSLFGGK